MDTTQIEVVKVKPKYVAQVCPNCNGRGTVGYDRKPCPTCGHLEYRGVLLIPVDERMDENEVDTY